MSPRHKDTLYHITHAHVLHGIHHNLEVLYVMCLLSDSRAMRAGALVCFTPRTRQGFKVLNEEGPLP